MTNLQRKAYLMGYFNKTAELGVDFEFMREMPEPKITPVARAREVVPTDEYDMPFERPVPGPYAPDFTFDDPSEGLFEMEQSLQPATSSSTTATTKIPGVSARPDAVQKVLAHLGRNKLMYGVGAGALGTAGLVALLANSKPKAKQSKQRRKAASLNYLRMINKV